MAHSPNPDARPKGVPEVEFVLGVFSGKRYLVVTSGGPDPSAQVVRYGVLEWICLRKVCLDAGKAKQCAHAKCAERWETDNPDHHTLPATL